MNIATLCVGADVHQKDILLRVLDKATGADVIDCFTVSNNMPRAQRGGLPGAHSAAATIANVAAQQGYGDIEIAWEATGMLWMPFHRFLKTSPLLQPFQLQLVCFNPQLVANFKKGLVLRRPKNDRRDAQDIAARLRHGDLPLSYVPNDFWQGLRRLTRYRFQLSRHLGQEKSRFRAYAFLKCSDWTRTSSFSDLLGATSIALLTEFTTAELQAMTHDQLVDIICRRGHGHFHDPTANARAVKQALLTSYPIDPATDEMVTATLATAWEHMRSITRLIKRLDQRIAGYMDPVPNPLITVKGLGAVITAGILAEIVDVFRFPDHKHLAQYMGLTWEKRSSGDFVSQHTRLTKVGDIYLRYYVILGADRLRQFNLEYEAYYWRKYQEVTTHQHKRALVLTARKLVRLVHALLTKNLPYVRPQSTLGFEGDGFLQ